MTTITVKPRERINVWQRSRSYLRVPDWLACRTEVSIGAKFLYGTLATRANRSSSAWPSQKCLCSALGIPERRLRRYLAELERHGLIEVVQRGRKQTNRYYFLDHPWINATTMTGQGCPTTSSDRTPLSAQSGRTLVSGGGRTPVSGPMDRTPVSGPQEKNSIRKGGLEKETAFPPFEDKDKKTRATRAAGALPSIQDLTRQVMSANSLLKDHPGKDGPLDCTPAEYADFKQLEARRNALNREILEQQSGVRRANPRPVG